MCQFAAAEHDRNLDFVAIGDKPLGVFLFHFIIMIFDIRPELDFFQRDDFLFLLGLFITLLLFEPEFAKVHDPTCWWFGCCSHFHQVELLISR